MPFLLRQAGAAGSFQLRVKGGIGPRLRIATNTSALVSGSGVSGRGFVGGSRIARAGTTTLISLVSLTGIAFEGSTIVFGGSGGTRIPI